ncbi:hypothetical protein VTN96DRAFT_5614 [Rasamsonia emersonii]
MSSDATRPNPGNVINRSNDEIPDYGRGAAHDNPDEMKNISSLHQRAAGGGTGAHRTSSRPAGSDLTYQGQKSKRNRRGPSQRQRQRKSRSRTRSTSKSKNRRT